MHPAEYDTMRQVEDRHWWYGILRGLALKALTARCGAKATVLDAGCGTGGMMEVVRQARPEWALHGVDLEPEAVAHCRARGLTNVSQESVCRLPFEDGTFDAVLSLDVLYHNGVNQDDALNEMARVLRPGGELVLNLPAFDSLRGSHDVAVCGVRRYRACHVRELLETHKMSVKMIHYWNAWLFLPLLFRRQWSREVEARPVKSSDLAMPSNLINGALSLMGRAEAWFCRGLRIPFGTSVFAVACKGATSSSMHAHGD